MIKPKIDHLLGRRVLLETEGSDAVLEKIDLARAIGHGRVMKEVAASQNKSKIVPAQTLPKKYQQNYKYWRWYTIDAKCPS